MDINVKMTRQENLQYHGVAKGVVVRLNIEKYLLGVLPAEIYESRTPREALLAQAIAARTYAVRKAKAGATIDDTTTYQAYRASLIAKSPRCTQAVKDTVGQVLYYKNALIECYYSNSNGGQTKRTDQVWSKPLPYYVNRADPWDIAARAGKTVKAGHGVGMSQVGAEYAAGIGVSCLSILDFYYPGTVVVKV